MPESVEMPAPVRTTTRLAASTQPRTFAITSGAVTKTPSVANKLLRSVQRRQANHPRACAFCPRTPNMRTPAEILAADKINLEETMHKPFVRLLAIALLA